MKSAASLALCLLSLAVSAHFAGAADWPGFRGPNGAGLADDDNLPVQWTSENVLWKLRLPGVGASKFEKLAHKNFEDDHSIFNGSPAISNGRMFPRSSEYLYCVGKK
jgi:hypothetical protein